MQPTQKVCERHIKCCINLITLNKDTLAYKKHHCYRWVFFYSFLWIYDDDDDDDDDNNDDDDYAVNIIKKSLHYNNDDNSVL